VDCVGVSKETVANVVINLHTVWQSRINYLGGGGGGGGGSRSKTKRGDIRGHWVILDWS